MSQEYWQDCWNWFEHITGLDEERWKERRGESIRNPNGDGITLTVRNLVTGHTHEAGAFQTMNLGTLENIVSTKRDKAKISPTVFEIRVRHDELSKSAVDVAHLQANAEDHECIFQVASNFNATETPHPLRFPNAEGFVSHYAVDFTQGPAAAASAAVAAITRTHAPFFDPNIPAEEWGQTDKKQVELLGAPELRAHFPVTNGKLWFQGDEPHIFDGDDLHLHHAVRIGLHRDVRAIYGRRNRMGEMITKRMPPHIDQVFVAALNMNAPHPYPEHLRPKTAFLLRAAYHGTYLAALHRNKKTLYLTLVGGGSFRNKAEMIVEAIAEAHAHWCKHPAAHQLQKVVLVLYSVGGSGVPALMIDALKAHNIPMEQVQVAHFMNGHRVQ